MLDHFVIGRVDRISPEAPVPVVQFDHEEYRLGGAANVAHNIAALGGACEVVGVVGTTMRTATRLRGELDAARRSTRPASSPTRPLHDAEAARRDDAQPAGRAHRLRGATARSTATSKQRSSRGSSSCAASSRCRPRLGLPEGRGVARRRRRRRSRQPRGAASRCSSIRRCRTSTTTPARRSITPNHHEAEAVTHMRIRTSDEARAAARAFPRARRLRQRARHARRARDDAAWSRWRSRAAGRSA